MFDQFRSNPNQNLQDGGHRFDASLQRSILGKLHAPTARLEGNRSLKTRNSSKAPFDVASSSERTRIWSRAIHPIPERTSRPKHSTARASRAIFDHWRTTSSQSSCDPLMRRLPVGNMILVFDADLVFICTDTHRLVKDGFQYDSRKSTIDWTGHDKITVGKNQLARISTRIQRILCSSSVHDNFGTREMSQRCLEASR